MRSFLLFATFLFFIFYGSAQSVTVKAFVQSSIPGNVPVGVTNENGTARKQVASQEHYYIYLIYNKLQKVVPVEAWIKGVHYPVKPEMIDRTPIELEDRTFPNQPKKIVLVPKTGSQVVQLLPLADGPVKMASAMSKAKTNELVVVYKLKNKFYTTTIRKLISLPAQVNE
jgi:hypothetical protein